MLRLLYNFERKDAHTLVEGTADGEQLFSDFEKLRGDAFIISKKKKRTHFQEIRFMFSIFDVFSGTFQLGT